MITILQGDTTEQLATLPEKSVNCAVTSPPYWGLRDYGVEGQLGLEPTIEEYISNLVGVFREVRRVLRDDGTLRLNMGDSFHKKSLVGQPWRLALALQADGWYLRSDIIWHKPNPMPESIRDRPTKSHEYLFLLTKRAKYYYDHDAVKEATTDKEYRTRGKLRPRPETAARIKKGFEIRGGLHNQKGARLWRNLRDVWKIPTQACPEAHFATFPEKLVEPCIKAGCPEGGVVLDPFGGSGTTALVARRLNRRSILIELNAEYIDIMKRRLSL